MPLVKEVLFLLLLVRVHAQTASSTNGSSLSNMSSTSFPTTAAPSFSYIIPYGQTQECDIYGLACQTGSITVGINLTTTTTTTVLPCSSYLTAQSNYIISVGQFGGDDITMQWEGGIGMGIVGTWEANFGRSPECTSFAQAFRNSLYTFSDCGSSNTIIGTQQVFSENSFGYPPQIPPGVVRLSLPDYTPNTCCGDCTLDFSELRLYYFPDGNSIGCQYNGTSNSTSAFPVGNLGKRMQSLIPDGSTAVVGENTFTSPSLYLQVVGTAGVRDECTNVGPVLTSPIMTLAPGELSTWAPLSEYTSAYFPTGQGIAQGPAIDAYGEVKPLLIRDLACPTWGVGISTSAEGTLVATIGSPFLPLIIPPSQAFTLDPTWSALCTGIMTNVWETESFLIFDPPTVLTPASNMVAPPNSTPAVAQASSTTAPEFQPTASAVPVKPASPPTNHEAPPAETGDPVVGSRVSSSSPAAVEPSPLVSDPDGPTPSASDSVDPRATTTPIMPAAPTSSAIKAGSPPISPAASPLASPDPSPGGPSDPVSVPNVPEQAATHVESSEPHTQDLGAIIYNAIGGSPTGVPLDAGSISPGDPVETIDGTAVTPGSSGILATGTSKFSLPDDRAFTVAGQLITLNPSAFPIAGGPAVTVDGTVVSLGPSGVLAIGSSTFTLPIPTPAASVNQTLIIAGQTITPSVSGFSVAGTTLSPGGPAVTINGTIVSLQSSGTLLIGSNSFALPTSSLSIYNLEGLGVQAESSFAVVDGVTVDPGAAGVTVGGSVVSLELGGKTLDVGSGRFAMPTGSVNGPNGLQVFQGGQGKGLRVSLPTILGICVFLTLMLC